MNNHQQHNLKVYNMSKLLVIGLSIILITGISPVATLEIKVQAQLQQQQAPAAPPSPGGNPSSGTSPPPPALDTADGGAVNQNSAVANQTDTGSSGAVNQTTMVMIPQSSVMTMIDNLQTAMDAVADDEDAMMALESVDQELRSAANASGISIETTTG